MVDSSCNVCDVTCRWYNKNGGLIVTTDEPGLRIDDADWSTLTIDAFPPRKGTAVTTRRVIVPRNATFDDRMELVLTTDEDGTLSIDIDAPSVASTDDAEQGWVVRVHLFSKQTVSAVNVDGLDLKDGDGDDAFRHIQPVSTGSDYFPFGGRGSAPAENAGPVVEFLLQPANKKRHVVAKLD